MLSIFLSITSETVKNICVTLISFKNLYYHTDLNNIGFVAVSSTTFFNKTLISFNLAFVSRQYAYWHVMEQASYN